MRSTIVGVRVVPVVPRARPVAVASLPFLVAWMAFACSGGGEQGPAPSPVSASAEREVVDDAPRTSSVVRVTFDRPIELAPSKVPLASHFELRVPRLNPGAGTSERTVLVQSAKVLEDEPRTIELRVDVIVPDGATLRIARKAFVRDDEGTLEVRVESGFSAATAVLAAEALELQDGDIIGEANPPPVDEEERDPAAQRAALEAHLRARGVPAEVREQALAAFDAMPAEIVPSAKARAALAALTGTFAEGALGALLTPENCTQQPAARIVFQVPPDAPQLFARVTYTRTGARIVSLRPELEGERLEHLMPILAHEAIHCDRRGGRFEEVAATALDSFLYLELLAAFPELAEAGTPLARELNVDAIAMINSGRALPESVGVLRSPGVTRVLPGTTDQNPSFAELVASAYPTITENESPDEALAQEYIEAIAARTGAPVASAFNLLYLDELLARSISAETLARAIDALSLGPPARR